MQFFQYNLPQQNIRRNLVIRPNLESILTSNIRLVRFTQMTLIHIRYKGNMIYHKLLETCPEGGGGTLLYGLYRYVRDPKGYGFSAVLVINTVSIIAILPALW